MPLKTMPNAMPCSPQKCRVDGTPHYLVPVSMWHDHEDDAREAHTLQARVNELEAERDRYRAALEEMSQELSHYPEGDGIFGHLKRILRRAILNP